MRQVRLAHVSRPAFNASQVSGSFFSAPLPMAKADSGASHPANPPTKRPLVALLKQGRAYGVGGVVASQNPMDLDYRALSNAGMWFVGRLQTDADRARVVEAMSSAGAGGTRVARSVMSTTINKLARRWFVLRNIHATDGTVLVHPRHAISWMRGPLTRVELRSALASRR